MLNCQQTHLAVRETLWITRTSVWKRASKENNWPVVSVDVYRRIFCENFNMGFRLPQSDTCKVCDKLSIDLQAAAE